MMSPKNAIVALTTMLTLVCASAANALTSEREWLAFCGPGLPGMTTCASVELAVSDNQVTLSIQNLSGLYGSYENFVITSISFFNTSATAIPDAIEGTVSSMTGPYRTANSSTPPPFWSVNNVPGSGGVFGLDFDAGVNGNDGAIASSCGTSLPGGSNDLWMTPACGSGGVTNAGLNNGWIVMTFAMSSFWDLDLTNTQFQIHAQSDRGSVKCTSNADCFSVLQRVPEPGTLALLGIGLAAIAAGVRCRAARPI